MQRGVLEFNNDQINVCLNQIKNSGQNVQFLSEKLQHALGSNGKNVSIELSEDEVDILLDTLPAPSQNDSKDVSELRKNLQGFLMQLRDKTPKKKKSLLSKLNPFAK